MNYLQKAEEDRKIPRKVKKKKKDDIKAGEDKTVKKSKRVFIEGDKEVIVTITEETVVRPLRKKKKKSKQKQVCSDYAV